MRRLQPKRLKIPGVRPSVFYLALLPVLLGVGVISWLTFRPDANSSSPPLKQVADQRVEPASLSSHDLKVSAAIRSTDGKELTDNKIISGNAVKVTVTLVNTSSNAAKFITIDTGLNSKNFLYARDFEGVSSATEDTGSIMLHNIVIQPGQTQQLSFSATPYAVKNDSFILQPAAYNADKNMLQRSAATQYAILAKEKPTDQVIQTTNE